MKNVVHAACPHDCPDACGVLITVEDGRATKIQGDPDHAVTRGFLCAKVAKYLDRVYSPGRVLYPMRRVAPKGAGSKDAADFQRISWDAALHEIADRLRTMPGWTLSGHAIVKQYTFKDFPEAVRFVDRIVPVAEAADHHPDILINYKRVTLTYATHASLVPL